MWDGWVIGTHLFSGAYRNFRLPLDPLGSPCQDRVQGSPVTKKFHSESPGFFSSWLLIGLLTGHTAFAFLGGAQVMY